MKQHFTASIWREGDWYIAQCLEFDAASQAETEVEALSYLREALELYFEPPTPTDDLIFVRWRWRWVAFRELAFAGLVAHQESAPESQCTGEHENAGHYNDQPREYESVM